VATNFKRILEQELEEVGKLARETKEFTLAGEGFVVRMIVDKYSGKIISCGGSL